MAKQKVLVVDDDVEVAEHIKRKLKKHGIEAEGVSSGKAALTYLKKKRPDLIIMDLLMPEMDGYAVSDKLRHNRDTENIPIIMLTARPSQEDKVKALQMGIDDYITKPYYTEELVARINAILRRSKPVPDKRRKVGALSALDAKRFDFLKALKKNKTVRIMPEYNMDSHNGYEYKIAADFFGYNDGGELEDLNHLTDRNVFRKIFHDKILICPYCYHHNINIRETSPTNHSSNISLNDTIHHYRCGYNGLESEFMQGVRYVCPKCNKELKLIGVDYDKPGKIYVDNESGEKFTEPEIYCQCRNCTKYFNANDAIRQNIFTFEVTEALNHVLDQGHFNEVNLEQEIIDQDINLYNLRYFRTKLSEEMIRAKEFKRPLSLMLVSIENFSEILSEKGDSASKKLLKDLTEILKEKLWSLDVPARYDNNSFVTLLVETDKTRATEIAKDIKQRLKPLVVDGMQVNIKLITFPKDAKGEEKLLEKLINSKVI